MWGAAKGISAGDALHAFAFELLLAPGPLATRRVKAAPAGADVGGRIAEGREQSRAVLFVVYDPTNQMVDEAAVRGKLSRVAGHSAFISFVR